MARSGNAAQGSAPVGGQSGAVEVLVVEDLENDIDLLTDAFKKVGGRVRLHVVRDGQRAIDYLASCGFNIPAMLLLDLKMPLVSGFDVLEWIRRDTHFRRLIVIVFSASDSPEDIKRAYDLGANSYVQKPIRFPELVQKVRMLSDYWLGMNRVGGAGGGER